MNNIFINQDVAKCIFLQLAQNKYADSLLKSVSLDQIIIEETIQKNFTSDVSAGTNKYFFGYFNINLIDNASKCQLEIGTTDAFVSENFANVSSFFGISSRINVTGNVNCNFSGYVVRIN
ncbi:MAG: hypothetical protein ACK5B9_03645 [Flavobacteriia bacterium]|jgi:hypothetical protein